MNNNLARQFDQYAASHQNSTNQAIHSIAVPLIYLSVLGLCWDIPTPLLLSHMGGVNFAHLAILIACLFYLFRSISITLGMLALSAISLFCFQQLEAYQFSVWLVSLLIFIVAWIAQFIGHIIEGQKPVFFEDITALLVGPGWVIAKLYSRLHIRL